MNLNVNIAKHISQKNALCNALRMVFFSVALFGAASIEATPIVFAGETLTPLQNGRFLSTKFGVISIVSASKDSVIAYSHAAKVLLQHRSDGRFHSWELGAFKVGSDPRWLQTSRFGWVHIGISEQTFNGWIHTEKYGWVKIERPGNKVYFWVPKIRSWMEVDSSGNLFSFEWGYLTQISGNRFNSSRFGRVTIGEVEGWVNSDIFGYLWAPGGGKWVWAAGRNEWLGILDDGQIWSTKEKKVIPITPPLEERIGKRGPNGGFVWKPKSEGDHKLVVLLPASLTDGIKAGWIADKDGNVVEGGRYVGSQHNGGREHYRFNRQGGDYGRDLFLVSRDRNNQLIHWPIPNGGARWDY